MNKVQINWPSVILFLVVMTLFGIALHKIDTNSLSAQQNSTARLTYSICKSRNASILQSNQRWNDEKAAWTAAAIARRASADEEADPILKKSDLKAAAEYQRVADDITPYAPFDCGAAP